MEGFGFSAAFCAPGGAARFTAARGCGFVDETALEKNPRLHTPQLGANWQAMWWYAGWPAAMQEGATGVCAVPAPGLPEEDLRDRALPLWYRAAVPGEGVYRVSLTVCGSGGEALVFAGRRRLAWRGKLEAGRSGTIGFYADVTPIVPDGESAAALNSAVDIAVVGAAVQRMEIAPAAEEVRRVFLIGDSTVTDQSAGVPYAPAASYAGWGQMLGWFLPDGLCVSNHAHSGLTTESFAEGGHWAVVEPRLRAGDVCLLQFGHNDQKLARLDAKGGYTDRLRGYIAAIRRKGGRPVLVTPLARNTWTAQGGYNDLLAGYAAAVRALGSAEAVPVIDLHARATEAIEAEGREGARRWFYPGDYTHTNDFGAYRVASFVGGALCRALGLTAPAREGWEIYGAREALAPPEGRGLTPPAGQGDAFAAYDAEQPHAPLPRADALRQITAALALFPTNGYRSPFADVVGQAPYAGAVQCAVQAGLIPPGWTLDGCLHPAEPVTLREFAAALLAGYAIRRPLPPADTVERRAVLAGLVGSEADFDAPLTRARGAAICRRVHI